MLYTRSHHVLIATSLAVAASFVAVPRAFSVESTPSVDLKCQTNSNSIDSNPKTVQTNALTPKVDSVQSGGNTIATEKNTKNNVVNMSQDEKEQKINDALCALRNLFSD